MLYITLLWFPWRCANITSLLRFLKNSSHMANAGKFKSGCSLHWTTLFWDPCWTVPMSMASNTNSINSSLKIKTSQVLVNFCSQYGWYRCMTWLVFLFLACKAPQQVVNFHRSQDVQTRGCRDKINCCTSCCLPWQLHWHWIMAWTKKGCRPSCSETWMYTLALV